MPAPNYRFEMIIDLNGDETFADKADLDTKVIAFMSGLMTTLGAAPNSQFLDGSWPDADHDMAGRTGHLALASAF